MICYWLLTIGFLHLGAAVSQIISDRRRQTILTLAKNTRLLEMANRLHIVRNLACNSCNIGFRTKSPMFLDDDFNTYYRTFAFCIRHRAASLVHRPSAWNSHQVAVRANVHRAEVYVVFACLRACVRACGVLIPQLHYDQC